MDGLLQVTCASWGQMGNDKVSAFQYVTAYTFSNPGVFGANGGKANTGLRLNRTANPNITWEVADTWNVGIESKFLDYFNFEETSSLPSVAIS